MFSLYFHVAWTVLGITSKLKFDLKTLAFPLRYLDNMRWGSLPPWDVCSCLCYQFIQLTVSLCFGITVAPTAARNRVDEICREKGEGEGRTRSQLISPNNFFVKAADCPAPTSLPLRAGLCTTGVVLPCVSNWLWGMGELGASGGNDVVEQFWIRALEGGAVSWSSVCVCSSGWGHEPWPSPSRRVGELLGIGLFQPLPILVQNQSSY